MVTSGVEDATRSLRASAAELEAEWSRARGAIDAEEQGIGDPADLLARTFLDTYKPESETHRKTAERLPRAFNDLADEAQAGVDSYLAHDRAGRDGFDLPR
jgi:hypothetical protein